MKSYTQMWISTIGYIILDCGYLYPIVDKTYTQLWIFRIGYTGSLLIPYFTYFSWNKSHISLFLDRLGSLGISYTQLWISTIGYIIYPIVDLMHNCGYAQLLNLSPIQIWSSKRILKIHLLLIHKYFSILICKQRMWKIFTKTYSLHLVYSKIFLLLNLLSRNME